MNVVLCINNVHFAILENDKRPRCVAYKLQKRIPHTQRISFRMHINRNSRFSITLIAKCSDLFKCKKEHDPSSVPTEATHREKTT